MAGLLLAIVLVLFFPLLIVHLSGLPWDRLADVGDAYGGASALLSAVALCGVGASLVYQQRQLRQEMVMIRRQQHFELVRLGIDDIELLRAVDQDLADSSDGRQQAYLNLMTNYWHSMWELGEIDDEELRELASSIFRGELGRRWWAKYGESWIGTRRRPGRRRFIDMMSEVCAAESAAAAVPVAAPERTVDRRRVAVMAAAVAIVAATIGVRSLRLRVTAG
ncbi:DUF6082 family protein [Actinoplanes sp. NPDC048791]|uniref:DUF6082 family protein n=1 Tax=Actinoplanes sp. NPDC048791 TaxID=3154623 RepID=UPI0033EB8ACC